MSLQTSCFLRSFGKQILEPPSSESGSLPTVKQLFQLAASEISRASLLDSLNSGVRSGLGEELYIYIHDMCVCMHPCMYIIKRSKYTYIYMYRQYIYIYMHPCVCVLAMWCDAIRLGCSVMLWNQMQCNMICNVASCNVRSAS